MRHERAIFNLKSYAEKIVANVPSVTNGNYNVTVTNSSSQVSNGIQFTVLAAKLIPVTFTVFDASPTQVGDYIFLTGNTVELSNWSTTWDNAVGPMLTPNYPNWFINASVPAGGPHDFQFRLYDAASGGNGGLRPAGPPGRADPCHRRAK